jgi:GNAT superfamily N-acetyltransferase
MTNSKIVQYLEELTLSTCPAIHQSFYDGWVLRASGTDTRRANSATALQASSLPLEVKLAHCEAWYQNHEQPAIFRMTEALSPLAFDNLLAKRHYTREVDTHVMTLDLMNDQASWDVKLSNGARIIERTEREGISDGHILKHAGPELHDRDLARQALWKGNQIFVSLRTHNGLASTGMARIEGDYVGIFSMRSAERARGKGYASALVAYLLTWGQAMGAKTAFLQVEVANEPAVSIYRKFGFIPQYLYWHRVAPKTA